MGTSENFLGAYCYFFLFSSSCTPPLWFSSSVSRRGRENHCGLSVRGKDGRVLTFMAARMPLADFLALIFCSTGAPNLSAIPGAAFKHPLFARLSSLFDVQKRGLSCPNRGHGGTMGENHSFWLLKRFLIFQGISGDLDANLLKHITRKSSGKSKDTLNSFC